MEKELTTKQKAIMEIAGMTDMDIGNAREWFQAYHGREATWEEAFDTLSSMRWTFASLFYQELAKLKIKETA
jgi:hypothetical protein